MKGNDPIKTFKSIDSYTGEEKQWNSYDEYIASFNNADKLINKSEQEVFKNEPTSDVPTTFKENAYNKALSSSSFQAGEGYNTTKQAGMITSKSLDKVIKERQSNITGNTWFDAGYALAQNVQTNRLNKPQVSRKTVKQKMSSERQRAKKINTPGFAPKIDIGNINNAKEVKGLPSRTKNPYLPY